MRIGIDFRFLSCGPAVVNRGCGRFSQQQLREVLSLGAPHDYHLLLMAGYDPALLLPEIAADRNVTRVELPPSLASLGERQTPHDVLRDAALLGALIDDLGLDVYHATTPLLAVDPAFRRLDSRALVATHYDLIPLVYPDHYHHHVQRQRYRRAVRELRHADRLLAISDFARREAHAHLGIEIDRIDVASPIAEPCFVRLAPGVAAERLAELRRRLPPGSLPDELTLAVSHLHHAKNLHTLLRAFALMPDAWRRRHPLVLAGNFDLAGQDQIGIWAHDLGVSAEVVLTGQVTDDELAALYNVAHVVVHPSRYEGFGLPVLEALRCGALVVAGSGAAVPEVAGDAALLVDAEDPAAFAAALHRLDGDPGLRRQLRAAALARADHFSPRQLGESTLRCYERAAADADADTARDAAAETAPAGQPSQASPRPRRPRLAVWSPLPPLPSGISDYTAELLSGLASWADVELFGDDGSLPADEILDGWPTFHYTAFERRRRWRPFDLVIYQVGASLFHLYMLDAALRWPGLLVLHDLTLGYVSFDLFAGGFPPDEVRRYLLENEGVDALAEYEALTRLELDQRTAATEEFLRRRFMLRGLVAASLAQVVHLPAAKDELQSLYPQARVHVVPMGVSDPWQSVLHCTATPREDLRRRYGLPADAFVVGAFGIADPVKRLDAAIRALARLATADVPGAHLILVGLFARQQYRLHLVQLAEDLGVADRVHIFQRVGKGELEQLLIACDAIVNLRHPYRKQMSATLLRAVAAGKPVAISDVPDWDPIPASFCHRVPADDPARPEDEALAAWLRRLALDPATAAAAGRAAREYYLSHATLGHMSDRYRAICEDVTGRRLESPTMPTAPATVLPAPPPAPVTSSGAPGVPAARGLRYNKACSVEDFVEPGMAALLRDVFSHVAAGRGSAYPAGCEDRKQWEIAMAVRTLRDHGALRPGAVLLGVGAGCEVTSFYLTRHAARVVATDLYLSTSGWDEANALMLTHPQALSPYPYDAWKLAAQHMDGRCLDFPDASFAGVFSSGAIEHFGQLADIAAAAYEIGRVLEPGGIAAISTELLIAAPPDAGNPDAPASWPGVVLLDPASLKRYIVAASGLEPVDELDLAVSAATLARSRDLDTVAEEIRRGERHLPHLVLSHRGWTFGSVHLALRKTDRYPAADNAWARPGGALRAEVAAAATAAGERLRHLLTGAPAGAPATAAGAQGSLEIPEAPEIPEIPEIIAPPPAPPLGVLPPLTPDAAFARWDEVRSRAALDAPARGSAPARAMGFLRRSLARVRDLGVAWDRERDVLRALLDAVAGQQQQLQALADRITTESTDARADYEAKLAALQAERQNLVASLADLTSRQHSLTARFGALSVRQHGVEEGLVAQSRALLLAEQHLGAGAAAAAASPLARGLGDILTTLERDVPVLAHTAAVEVSAAGPQAEELERSAAAHFGRRLSSRHTVYRFPNDAWLHIDLASNGERPILLANAAGRLTQGGHFLLLTAAGRAHLDPHPHLRPAVQRDFADDQGTALHMLVWEKF